MNRRALVALAVGIATAWLTCVQCSAPSATGLDAGPSDAGRIERESATAPPSESGPDDANDPLPDAADGWRYFTELGPSCDMQVPLSPAVLPKLTWTACPSKHPSCAQWDTSAWQGGPFILRDMQVSGDKRWFTVEIFNNALVAVDRVLYDFTAVVPLTAWRVSSAKCTAGPYLGDHTLAIFASTPRDAVAVGPVAGTAITPTFSFFDPLPAFPADFSVSESTLAVDQQGGGGVIRWPVGSTSWKKTNTTRLWAPLVVGDDVFAEHEYGNANWTQLVRVDADGSVTPMRAVPMRHVLHARIHAGWFYWTELYGDPKWSNFNQPFAEVWGAPYTTSPSTLAATAQKLAQVDGVAGGVQAVAFDSYYAVGSAAGAYLYVVRTSDGAVQKLDLFALVGPSTWSVRAGFVSATEVWGTTWDDRFVKLKLGPWP